MKETSIVLTSAVMFVVLKSILLAWSKLVIDYKFTNYSFIAFCCYFFAFLPTIPKFVSKIRSGKKMIFPISKLMGISVLRFISTYLTMVSFSRVGLSGENLFRSITHIFVLIWNQIILHKKQGALMICLTILVTFAFIELSISCITENNHVKGDSITLIFISMVADSISLCMLEDIVSKYEVSYLEVSHVIFGFSAIISLLVFSFTYPLDSHLQIELKSKEIFFSILVLAILYGLLQHIIYNLTCGIGSLLAMEHLQTVSIFVIHIMRPSFTQLNSISFLTIFFALATQIYWQTLNTKSHIYLEEIQNDLDEMGVVFETVYDV